MSGTNSLATFGDPTRRWFERSFDTPTEVQARGWQTISRGAHTLLIAPTGSGKTLAAFLWSIDALSRLAPDAQPGVRVVYVSPLKALVYDIERNLRAPLVGIQHSAARLNRSLRDIRIDVRTGDTPQPERQRQARSPGDILVTTPESLFLLLAAKGRDTLRSVTTVIVDEIHALAPTKRGVHLALTLERLSELCATEPQRIGLSATVRPHDEIARFLGGDRPVEVVDTSQPPNLSLSIDVPVPDMTDVRTEAEPRRGGPVLAQLEPSDPQTPRIQRGIWPKIYPAIVEQIRAHRSTIIFVNSRGLCERLCQHINELTGEELVRAHHGSVSHEQRAQIEEALKQGRLPAIVATSSLELGIDMGAVDLVILVESPGSVARGLQRVGRAGHHVGEASIGCVFPKTRGDLLECAVIAARMQRGELEAMRVPRNALDVLAQQLVAMCCDTSRRADALLALARRAYPYQELSQDVFHAVLDMLSGHYPSTEFADLRPLLNWNRDANELSARRGAALTSRMNAGTIVDRGNYGVYLGSDGPRVGELDEEMVFESRAGDNILLGASTWHVEEITRDRVIVTPAPGEPGRLPFWRGEGPGRPIELGRALGAFVRELDRMSPNKAVTSLSATTPLSQFAARNLIAYLREQKEHTGVLPTDRAITIERFRDELGDWRFCVLSPFGARVHAPWALALQQQLSQESGFDVQLMYTDDGIVVRFADTDDIPDIDMLVPDPDELDELLTRQLAESALFAGLFRENAARSLLLPRRRAQQRTPLWAQRLKSQHLLAAVKPYPSFPIVLETYRQALSDVFDVGACKTLLGQIRAGDVRVDSVETRSASPFARELVFAYVASYIYEQDTPLAERKAQALTLDRNLLAELLGQAELRELIDPDVLSELEDELQHLSAQRRAESADDLFDVLRRIGDLDRAEVGNRCREEPQGWLEALEQERRIVRIRIGASSRWIVAHDAGLYRDALGVQPPAGLPDSFLIEVPDALVQLARRYARTHGPFHSGDLAARYDLLPAQVEPALGALEHSGTLVRGEIRPGGATLDWCDSDVLRRLKRRTLAKLRHEVAPVEAHKLALYLASWHGLTNGDVRPTRSLDEVIDQLEGLPLAWSLLNNVVLPARVTGFKGEQLDLLAASGQVLWVGHGASGSGDGRIALYRRDRFAEIFAPNTEYAAPSPLHDTIIGALRSHGAMFSFELEDHVRARAPDFGPADFEAALWDLVWESQISNDTFAPLRAQRRTAQRASRRRASNLAGGRWSLVANLLRPEINPTQQALARANMLLRRYGIVSREAGLAERIPGGFGPIYKALSAMEETGRVRRGYFVEELSAAQFAHVGSVDRLRAVTADNDAPLSEDDVLIIAAADPANPYGTLLPWPRSTADEQPRLRRVGGAWLILVRGRPVLYVGPNGRQLSTIGGTDGGDEDALSLAFSALARLPRAGRRRLLTVERVDGVPVNQSPHLAQLKACGFESDYRGLTRSLAG